jgi:hypothetical protein
MQTRQELVLMFMLALASNSSWHEAVLIHTLAEELADVYLEKV